MSLNFGWQETKFSQPFPDFRISMPILKTSLIWRYPILDYRLRYLKCTPPHPPDPLQCNAYPSLGPYTFLEFLYAYTKWIAAQRTKDFFFIRWLASTRQNQFNYRDVFKYRKTTTQRYKCIFLLKGRLNNVKDNLLILYDYLHSNFIQSLSYVEDFNPYTVSTKTKNSINYKKYKLQYRQELK